jgi:hypothetical protein
MEELNYVLVATVASSIFLIQVAFIKSELRSIFDPLMYIILSLSFSMTLAIFLLDDVIIFLKVFLYTSFFWIGFRLVIFFRHKKNNDKLNLDISPKESKFFVLMIVSTSVCLLSNIFAWGFSVPPIFSSDPTLQKVESMVDGLGIVRRLNWGVGVFATLAALYGCIYSRKKIAFICLTVNILIALVGGGKGAFLTVIFGIGLYIYHPFLDNRGRNCSLLLGEKSFFLFLLALVPVVLIFVIQTPDAKSFFLALATRLLFFGDSLLYWGQSDLRLYFSNLFTPISYLSSILNPVSGFFRLTPYVDPIGNQFVQYTLTGAREIPVGLGPNVPFYVKGELFFGPLIAPIYSLAIGGLVAIFRLKFFSYSGISIEKYTFLSSLVVIANSLPIEDNLFISRFFDFFLLIIPIFLLSRFIFWMIKN